MMFVLGTLQSQTWMLLFDPVDEFVGINTEGIVENDSDLNGVDTELLGDLDAIPDEDDSDVDEELLGGDEKCIDSSECDCDDNNDMLDAKAVGGVDLPDRRKRKKVRYDDECTVAIFELGMIFENAKEFRKALAKYAVEKNYQIKLRPNEAHRVRTKCKFKEKCKWLCYGAIDRDSGNFMIKNYYPIHKCLPSNKNKMCTTKFLVSRFKDEITKQPSLRIWEIQELCREELGLQVGRTICYKANMMILRENMSDWNMEFARLCDYAEVIKQTDPGSSVWERMDRETVPGKNLFVYFYVCLDALKKGWKEGCRRIIGFDGCLLKDACKGELLVAVGRNGNNQMFPIAWAVMDKETKHNSSFFINYLKEDLQLGTRHGLSVMSDMQKGLQAAVGELLPNAEVRMCARHIWSNWSKRWKGEERRKQFWRCSKATFEVKYNEELYKMSRLGNEINDDLLHYPQVSWVRAFFQEHSKYDAVENNMCETFNSWILSCRHKSIITMLEEIRRKLMTRTVDMVKFADIWICDIAPMTRLMLEENKEKSRACKVLWNADVGFEIGEGQYRHTVNLTNRVCSCRTWQLRGIPCQHTISALYHIEQEPESLVEHWYRKDTFLKAYSHFIQPIPNMKMWPETNNPRIEPLEPKQMPGRPPRNRRKSKDEQRKKYGKMSKQGVKITCSKCKQQGHNKEYCKVGVHTSQPASHNSQFTAGQSSQGSCHPEPTSSFQPGPTRFNQPASTTSNKHASSTTVCGDTSRVKRARETAKTSQPPPFVDTNSTRWGPKRPTNGGSSNVGFGIYTSASGTQILNPGTSSQRILPTGSSYKDASLTGIELGFKPRGLRWKNKDAVTTSQLQQMANKKKK
ncbi:uncharacterized protein LOC125854873 [Solanum stenotomum]|uniref:uncharacterized protein LOC125854873 n=1 Tax=Solanum stenotomum TaxID=172797 RepID=UPI0020D19650|nr:uncharacterized protein LOC125854873 [Solanum stenotomum]